MAPTGLAARRMIGSMLSNWLLFQFIFVGARISADSAVPATTPAS
jgi:hypothetical protein